MKRIPLAAVLLIAPLILAADPGDAPAFKSRDAIAAHNDYQRKLDQAKLDYQRTVELAAKVYRRELKAAQERAMRMGNAAETQRIADAVARIDSATSAAQSEFGIDGKLTDALEGTRWTKGGGAWFELLPDGIVASSYSRNAGVWHVRDDGTVVMAHGQSVTQDVRVYQFSKDGSWADEQRVASGVRERWSRVK